MRLDLEALIPSIMFGGFIFMVILAMNFEMANSFGVHPSENNTLFNMNRTMTQALSIQSNVSSNGLTATLSSFFPGASTLFKIFDISKAAIQDLKDAITGFFSSGVFGGNKYVTLFISILIISIGVAVAFIILNSFFRIGGGGGFRQY